MKWSKEDIVQFLEACDPEIKQSTWFLCRKRPCGFQHLEDVRQEVAVRIIRMAKRLNGLSVADAVNNTHLRAWIRKTASKAARQYFKRMILKFRSHQVRTSEQILHDTATPYDFTGLIAPIPAKTTPPSYAVYLTALGIRKLEPIARKLFLNLYLKKWAPALGRLAAEKIKMVENGVCSEVAFRKDGSRAKKRNEASSRKYLKNIGLGFLAACLLLGAYVVTSGRSNTQVAKCHHQGRAHPSAEVDWREQIELVLDQHSASKSSIVPGDGQHGRLGIQLALDQHGRTCGSLDQHGAGRSSIIPGDGQHGRLGIQLALDQHGKCANHVV